MWPSAATITQPTAGFGATWPNARAAKRSAWRIWPMSSSRRFIAPHPEERSRSNAKGPRLEGSIPIDAGEFAHEGFEVLRFAEVLVYGGEADIGDLVQRGERLHHQFANHAGLNLVLAQAFKTTHDAGDHAFDALGLDGALSQGVMDRALQLLALERPGTTTIAYYLTRA